MRWRLMSDANCFFLFRPLRTSGMILPWLLSTKLESEELHMGDEDADNGL